jgi:hypothetical protein
MLMVVMSMFLEGLPWLLFVDVFKSCSLFQVRRRLIHVGLRVDRRHRLQGQDSLPARQKS